ncbi:NUDIX hydrolase [Mesobacterium sp. TK19101]|uniref:NUDIX hydrolase n=1 Tax=Mesobacterium hydrothermale TaxID=3111907 RepID=A0ABU6HDJ8_9RHOB|nr:NUDIX hydrolase [Mesobacterium sp. TK19101]MEC3860061.1 NUDIX hydrolase [Mesobacterium sp. TK19101]
MQVDGIGAFAPRDARDAEVWHRIAGFVAAEPRAFSRDPRIGGHVTGSAFILSPDGTSALLTHHRKLDMWIQLGGHCDGIADARFVALKEAYEESGLARLRLVSDAVFDVDIHEIPANPKDPAHLHYDVRFLMRAEAGKIAVSQESNDLAWVPLTRIEDFSREPSLLRMRDRVLAG